MSWTVEETRRIRAERQARGVCPVHPSVECKPFKYCERCRKIGRDYKAQVKADRLTQGMCIDCGLVPMGNGGRCHECGEYKRTKWRLMYGAKC